MKNFLLGAAAATLLFAGCAQNELLDGVVATPNDGRIYFSATSGVPTNTRAAAGNPYNSTADLQGVPGKWGEFRVMGYSGTTPIVGTAGAPTEVTFNGVSWEYPNEPYWPNSAMDFFAYANWDNVPTIDSNGITATNVEIAADKGVDEANSYKQKDLLVAATLGATKEVRTLLNFKHALTQIVFKAGNINPTNIDVKIGGVEIVNVGSKGNMNFLKADNAIKWVETAAAGTTDEGTSIIPNGTLDAAIAPRIPRITYEVAGIDATVAGGFTVPTIAAADANTYSKYPRIQTALEPNNNALILMPQNFKAWDANSGVKAVDQNGTYIKLTALITKTALDPTNPDASKFIYAGSVNNNAFVYGTVYIPVESLESSIGQWVPGKRINYIITFGDSNSGSGGGGYDENGDPILVPIRFRAVVEDWVETNVPLLTATFEATSSAITHKFIDAYTNQLLADISAAPAPKVYNSEIKINGTVSSLIKTASDHLTTNTAVVDFQKLLGAAGSQTFYNAKFRPGSTLVFNFSGVTDFNGKTIDVLIPAGWEGRSYSAKDATNGFILNNQKDPAANVAKAAGQTLTIGGVDGAKYAVLTKIATTDYSYICHIPYIEDNLAAIEMNENPLVPAELFNNTVYVKGTFPIGFVGNAFSFSSEMLSKFTAAHYDVTTPAKVTIDLSGVTQTAPWSITTWVPAGWSAQIGGTVTIMYPGDPITVTDGTAKTMVFTKTNLSIAHSYVRATILIPMLNVAVNSNEFYWDNVDYNVPIDLAGSNPFATATWDNLTANDKVTIKLKYPIKIANVTVITGWTVIDDGTYVTDLVYTK